jgi:hypothetical protein
MKKPAFKFKVNIMTLIRWVRKLLKWRRQNIINNNREDVPEKPV